jgi:energy-coupling factor transporter ATP-binding protein EcfA2
MINSLRLENFKCFESLNLDIAPLTLLTGFNAAGKSTTLQTLLLLCQTLRAPQGVSDLRLNGPLVNLGSPGDVINWGQGGSGIGLGVASEVGGLFWRFTVGDDERRSLRASQVTVLTETGASVIPGAGLDGIRPPGNSSDVLRRIERLIFLSAARQVESEVFPVPQETEDCTGDVGPIGQFAAWWFNQEADTELPGARHHRTADIPSTLRHQLNAWAEDLFPGAEVNALPVPRTSLMRLELRTSRTADWSRPANVGYGISYAFPILVAGLCADTGRVLVIDSPEAHLHPRGQSRIGDFLAHMAAAGSQILVETHSDHVLNGIRLALRDGVIDPEKVIIYFFTLREGPQVTRLSFDKNGSINDWPAGFFDQSEKDLASLAGWA